MIRPQKIETHLEKTTFFQIPSFKPPRFHKRWPKTVFTGGIAVLPLVFRAWEIAALFSFANLVLLRHRIRVEDEALAPRRGE